MLRKNNEVISIKNLKKDGSVDPAISEKIIETLRNGDLVAMSVDSLYGIAGLVGTEAEEEIVQFSDEKNNHMIKMIVSFKMLDEIALIDKPDYDFLHRVWPGEVVVKLNKKDSETNNKSIFVRIPKIKFVRDIIESLEAPLIYVNLMDSKNRHVYKYKDIIKKCKKKVKMIFLIKDYCKEFPHHSLVDLTQKSLNIVTEGRISSEELKSLYFLNKE